MKKVLYFALLIAELFVGSVLMISLWNSSLYIPVAISAASVVGLWIWQIVRYVRATDPEAKKRNLINIALFALIPMAVFFITYVVVAVIFIFAFV